MVNTSKAGLGTEKQTLGMEVIMIEAWGQALGRAEAIPDGREDSAVSRP